MKFNITIIYLVFEDINEMICWIPVVQARSCVVCEGERSPEPDSVRRWTPAPELPRELHTRFFFFFPSWQNEHYLFTSRSIGWERTHTLSDFVSFLFFFFRLSSTTRKWGWSVIRPLCTCSEVQRTAARCDRAYLLLKRAPPGQSYIYEGVNEEKSERWVMSR
jgi:hypothetical protein